MLDGITLTFTASSQPEVISWVLSLGDEARILKPDWLVKEIKNIVGDVQALYQ